MKRRLLKRRDGVRRARERGGVILVDTNAWIRHFEKADARLGAVESP